MSQSECAWATMIDAGQQALARARFIEKQQKAQRLFPWG
jgi:hypothetical protein